VRALREVLLVWFADEEKVAWDEEDPDLIVLVFSMRC
jgi:hypothetical protein